MRWTAFLALGLTLLMPAAASAETRTFGSRLDKAPTANAFGCESKPTLSGDLHTYVPTASNTPDCTWRQSGVVTSDPNEPRFSSVPGDGTITKVEVRTGNNPAPLRFVVLSQLGNTGSTEVAGECCFFVSETAPLPMAPNTVNTFNVNIPVERNTLNGIRRFDLMAISAASGTGVLPLAQVGPVDQNAAFQPGTVMAGFFYPRMSANAQDTGGGRRESGVPGFELTVRWTWESAPQGQPAGGNIDKGGGGSTAAPAPPPGSGPPLIVPLPATPAFASTVVPIKSGKALIDMACQGNTACQGQLELLSAGAGAAKATRKPKKPVSYGKAGYNVPAGGKAKVKVALNAKARSQLRKHRRLSVTARITPAGGAPTTSRLTLKR
jgi:hypothetical protein